MSEKLDCLCQVINIGDKILRSATHKGLFLDEVVRFTLSKVGCKSGHLEYPREVLVIDAFQAARFEERKKQL